MQCSDLEFQSTHAHFGIVGGPGGFPPGYERRRQNFFGILVGDTQKVHMPHTCPTQAPLNRAHMPREKVHMPTHAQRGACVGMCANSSTDYQSMVKQPEKTISFEPNLTTTTK